MDPANFDREKFNSDPAFEKDRSLFDTMVEDSFQRIATRKQKENPKPKNIFDAIFGVNSGNK